MNVVAIPIIESNTELQGMRHSSMTALGVGGTTDRNSLRARQANGAAMLVEVEAAAVAVLLLDSFCFSGKSCLRFDGTNRENEKVQSRTKKKHKRPYKV